MLPLFILSQCKTWASLDAQKADILNELREENYFFTAHSPFWPGHLHLKAFSTHKEANLDFFFFLFSSFLYESDNAYLWPFSWKPKTATKHVSIFENIQYLIPFKYKQGTLDYLSEKNPPAVSQWY